MVLSSGKAGVVGVGVGVVLVMVTQGTKLLFILRDPRKPEIVGGCWISI